MPTLFTQFPEIFSGMSEKKDGSMRIASSNSKETAQNRERFFVREGIDPEKVFAADLVHGKTVRVITKKDPSVIPATDALVTKEKGLFLSVTVADCVPILFYDPQTEIVGIAHAGWRGTLTGVIEETLKAMLDEGARKENIFVTIGPHIQSCHFEIQADISNQFDPRFITKRSERNKSKLLFPNAVPVKSGLIPVILKREGKMFVDLQSMIKEKLLHSGVSEENIQTIDLCTYCEKNTLFSYRRDKPADVEAMVAVIGMK